MESVKVFFLPFAGEHVLPDMAMQRRAASGERKEKVFFYWREGVQRAVCWEGVGGTELKSEVEREKGEVRGSGEKLWAK